MFLRAWSRRLRRNAKDWLWPQSTRQDDFVRLGLARLEDRLVLDGAGVVADLNPGTGSSNPTNLTEFNGSYYFTADGTNAAGQSVGRELFRLNDDGTVTLVADINPGAAGSDPGEFAVFNPDGSARLLFAAQGPQGRELYQMDTSGNVSLVFDVNPGSASSDPKLLSEFNGKVYFTAFSPATGRELYVVNNGGNVSLVDDLNPGTASSNPGALYEFAGRLYFSAEVGGTRHLFRQAPSGTSDPVQINLGSGVSDPRDFVTFNNKLYFSAIDNNHGRELFSLAVAQNGRETVNEIYSLEAKSPEGFFVFRDSLYFSAVDASGRELYRMSSTESFAKLNLAAGSASSSPGGFVEFQGDLYFAATVGGSRGLWRINTSTTALSAVAVPLPAGVVLPQEAIFYALAGELYFAADGPAGRELYVMNTARAVSLAADINAGPVGSHPAEVIRFGDEVYVVATAAEVGRELFVLRNDPSSLRIEGGKLVFNDDAGNEDNRLVISSTGTHLVVVDENGHTISLLTSIAGATGAGTSQVIIPLASLSGINALDIFTRGGNDSVTFDLSAHADSLLAQFVTSAYDGGANTAAGDKLRFVGDGVTSSVYTPSATTEGNGVVVVSTPDETLTFRFVALEPVDFTGMAEAWLVTPTTLTGADVLLVTAGFDSLDGLLPALVVSGTVGGTTIESGYFFGNEAVYIDTGSGLGLTDSVTIASAANDHGNTHLTIDTGPLGQDVVNLAGPVALAGNLEIRTATINVHENVSLGGSAQFAARSNIAFGAAAQLSASQVSMQSGGLITLASGSLVDAGAGTISLLAAGNISLGRLVTTSGATTAVTVTSLLGNIFSSGTAGGPNIEAESLGSLVTLTAGQGIGTAASPLDLAVRNLVTTSSGNQHLRERDNLASLDLNAGTGDIFLAAGGQIQDGDASIDIRASGLVLSATQAGTLLNPLQTQIATLVASVSGGDLHLVESNGLTVVSAAAPAGDIELRSLTGNLVIQSLQAQGLATLVAGTGAILAGAAGTNVTAGDLELSAAGGVGTSSTPLTVLAQRLEAFGGTGGIYLYTPGNVQIGGIGPSRLALTGLSAVGANIRLTSGGSIQTVESIVTSGSGGIDVSAAGGLTIGARIESALGPLTLGAGRNIATLAGGDLITAGGAVRLVADTDNVNGGAITLADGTLVDAASGTITLLATGDITLGRLVTTSGSPTAVLVRSAAGRILDGGDKGGADITAETAGAVTTLEAALGIGTSSNPLDLAVQNLVTRTNNSHQFLSELDNLASLDLNAGSGNIFLTAGGQIQDGDSSVDIRAAALVLQAAAAGTWLSPLQTELATLTATTLTGELYLQEQNGLSVLAASAAGNLGLVSLAGNLVVHTVQSPGLVTLVAGKGAILAGAAGTNVTASDLELSAAGGVGTSSIPLTVLTKRLEAFGGTGGIYIASQAGVQIGGISPSLLGLAGLSTIGSDIVVTVAGTLSTVERIATTGSGQIDLSAAGDLIVQAPIASDAGSIELTALRALRVEGTSIQSDSGAILLVGNPGAIPATGAFSGITLSSAIIASASGAITLQGQGGAAGGHGVLLVGSSVGQFGSGDVLLAGQGTLGLADLAWDSLTLAKSGGTFTFQDTIQGDQLIVLPGPYQVVFLDGGIIQQAVTFQNTGGVVIGNGDGDSLTIAGGITSTAGLTTIQGTLLTSGTNITLGSTKLVGTVTLGTVGGDISIGPIDGAGVPLAIDAAAGDVVLADPSNVIGDLTIVAHEVTIVENDDITQGGAWNTTGLTTLDSGSHAIVLTNPANRFGPLALRGGNILVVEGADTELVSAEWQGLLSIYTRGSLLVDGLLSGSGVAVLTAEQSVIFSPDGELSSPGGSVEVAIVAGSAITLQDGSLVDAGAGTIHLLATRNITLGRLITTSGADNAVTLISVLGSILSGAASGEANIEAESPGAVVTLTAAQGIGTAVSPLDLAVQNLVTASLGSQFLHERDDLASLNLTAVLGTIYLTAGGQIQDSDSRIDIAARGLVLSATGAGMSSSPLQTVIGRLEAVVGEGGLFLANSTALEIGGATTEVAGISSKGGPVWITAGGSVLVSETITVAGDGTLDLLATGDITLAALVSTAAGDATLAATRNIVAVGSSLAATAGGLQTASGTIWLLADSDRLAGGTIRFAGDIHVGTGQVIFEFPDADGQLSGSIHGDGGVVKQGAGTLTVTLASLNTYRGTTDLLAGTMRVDGTIGAQGSAATFFLAGNTLLTGGGVVNAQILATSTTARIVSLGKLSLGDGSSAGFALAGTLLVASGDNLTIRDADRAELGILTQIAAGGQLTALNGVAVGSGELLAGSGAVRGNIVVLAGGAVSPGFSPGILSTAPGNIVLFAGSIFLAEINGTQPGLEFDQLNVQGTVNISGAILNLSGGNFNPPRGTVFTLIANDDAGGIADRVVGQFAGLGEGATMNFGGFEATISYVGGTGNDITLTVADQLQLIRTPTPDADPDVVVDGSNDTGGGGGVSYSLRTEAAPVLLLESTRPVVVSQGVDIRQQTLETRSVERLRVFLKVVDEVTGEEEGSAVDLDPRVIDDVLGFFRRVRFPSGKYRIYLQEAGRSPRLILEIAIRDGQVVSPESAPAPASPIQPRDASPPVPAAPAGEEQGAVQESPAAAALAAGEELAIPEPSIALLPADRSPRTTHRWSHAAQAIAASLAVAAAASAAAESKRQPVTDSSCIPRTRFHRRLLPNRS